MEKKVWLVCDVANLAWRAFHTFKGMSHGGSQTGVTYGLLRDFIQLMDLHATRHIAFCFSHGTSIRKQMHAGYKLHTPKEEENYQQNKEAFDDIRKQIERMKTKHLPKLGLKNIFYQDGYEGDDMIAVVCRCIPNKDEALIVSTDEDMLQLLNSQVSIWHPIKKECITVETFTQKWGIIPARWADVKALAGCKSDKVKGIKGIGEITAAKYIRGELVKGSNAYNLIQQGKDIYKANKKLVKLPLEGAKDVELQEDEIRQKAWKGLTEKLGMRSIANRVPGMVNGFGLRPKKI